MSSRKVSAVRRFSKGFTLIELLLAMTVLAVILMTLAMMMNQTTGAWRQARSQLEQFREAEAAFGSMGRRITDAVLNTYTDYEFPGGDRRKTPTRYVRQSELHFVCGPGGQVEGGLAPSLLGAQAAPGQAVFFQGPFGSHSDGDLTGLNTLLNAWGYFVEFGDDREARPGYLEEAVGAQPRHRFRLKEFQQKTEELRVYASNLTAASQDVLFDWFRKPVSSGRGVHTLAENVIALVIRPMSSDKTLAAPTQMASHYYYDTRAYQQNVGTAFEQARSRHQLPPLLEITLVELLTVICLVFMLLTLVSVGTSHLVQAAKLSEAVAQVESMLRLAAQRAGIENCEVEVRFYEIDTGAGEGMRFAAMQTMCYRIETDPAAAAYISPGSPGFSPQPVAVSELQRLPSGVVVHEGLFSTLLTDPSRVPDPATAEVDGLPSRVRRVRFLPGGGTDLGAGKKWCVLLCRSQDAAVTSLPANYAVLVIDPETARCSLFRPQ